MTNIKEWINTEYSKNDRPTLTDLYLSSEKLEGDLKLTWEEFPKLERVWYNHKLRVITHYDLAIATLLKEKAPQGISLEVANNVQILKYTPIEEVMEKLYPENERAEIITLNLTQKGLRGTLDLGDFENLKELTINMDCPWGRKYTKSNYITGLNLPESLTKLTLTNNPIKRELGTLVGLTNLEELNLKGDSKYPAQWIGSLKELENLEKLTKLDISYNPNIKLGLENFENLEEVEVKGTVYEKSLKSFNGDVKAWKVIIYPEKVTNKNTMETRRAEIIQKINECLEHSHGFLKFLNEKGYTNRDLVNKIELLETRNRELLAQ
ncbi:protein of unknown function [endosymbiont DhMRE of Dentiscutata heterogama]|uniref:hypothetical protein n=1 Tax=endosymbiont DhMRE of Dentiscutata heterogama TaxID=1609546 RepID=UPI000629DB4F|nr:hypothetical protein [endosymbiont DhMRE of Dentiscutata heterogama]CFW92974.1 protein of unknown function [endosymbiont DhMRE of Dentiscutata heterogama]